VHQAACRALLFRIRGGRSTSHPSRRAHLLATRYRIFRTREALADLFSRFTATLLPFSGLDPSELPAASSELSVFGPEACPPPHEGCSGRVGAQQRARHRFKRRFGLEGLELVELECAPPKAAIAALAQRRAREVPGSACRAPSRRPVADRATAAVVLRASSGAARPSRPDRGRSGNPERGSAQARVRRGRSAQRTCARKRLPHWKRWTSRPVAECRQGARRWYWNPECPGLGDSPQWQKAAERTSEVSWRRPPRPAQPEDAPTMARVCAEGPDFLSGSCAQ